MFWPPVSRCCRGRPPWRSPPGSRAAGWCPDTARGIFAGLAALLLGALAALAAYGAVPAASYPWPLLAALAALAACGLGQGLFAVPFFTTALHRVRPHETGSAAGLLNAAQQLGGTLGIALLDAVFLHTATAAPPAPAVAVLDGARHAFWAAVALLTATGLAAAALHAGARTPRVLERTPRPAAGADGTVSGE